MDVTVCRWKEVHSSYLKLHESGLPFCLLVAFFHRPSLPGHGDQRAQADGAAGRGVAVEERKVRRVRQAAADQYPVPLSSRTPPSTVTPLRAASV